jgi:poly(glycerol-phosphate) alpha-glucosyltransferase
MKVALTTGSLSRDAGGLFESVRSLGQALTGLGDEVSAYGLWDKNWPTDAHKWSPLSARAFDYVGPRFAAWAPRMDQALDETHPDILHLQGLWQYSSLATRRHWRRHGTPYLVSPRGMMDPWALANSKWKKTIAAWVFENAVLRDAMCFHALCASEADAIRAYGLSHRIEVVPNGVELPEKLNTEETESAKGKKRLLFLGRIHPKKGLLGALRAWAELKRDMSQEKWREWQFVIAGWDQGGHEGELKRLCADLGLPIAECGEAEDLKLKTSFPLRDVEVVFFGPAFGMEKEALLRSSEAFVLPSFSEGLPMSVLEAWAYGLPVVMTPECNLPEGFACEAALEIRNGGESFQFPNFRIQDGLWNLLEMSAAERAAMGMRGRRLVEEKFTWPKVAAQMRALYEGLLGK